MDPNPAAEAASPPDRDEPSDMSPRLAEALELFDILSHTMFAVAPMEIGTIELHELPDRVRAMAVERADLKVQNNRRVGILLQIMGVLGDVPVRTEDGLPGDVAALQVERDHLKFVLDQVERYIDHRPECAIGADYPCDCGFDLLFPQRHVVDPTSPTYDHDQYGVLAANFYVCPDHARTGGYESCCACGGWEDGDPNHGRLCSEATDGV